MTELEAKLERLVPIGEALARLPGPRPSPCSVWRWINKGSHGVYLKAYRLGRRTYLDPDDLLAFMQALAEARRTSTHLERPARSAITQGSPPARKIRRDVVARGEAARAALARVYGKKTGSAT